MQQTKGMREMERARKRFKFFVEHSICYFVMSRTFLVRFSSFRNLLCRFLSVVLVLCLILHTHLSLSASTDTCRGIIWIDREIWQILVPLMCSAFFCASFSLLLITFHVSDDRLVSDWNIARRIGVRLNNLAFLWILCKISSIIQIIKSCEI